MRRLLYTLIATLVVILVVCIALFFAPTNTPPEPIPSGEIGISGEPV